VTDNVANGDVVPEVVVNFRVVKTGEEVDAAEELVVIAFKTPAVLASLLVVDIALAVEDETGRLLPAASILGDDASTTSTNIVLFTTA
jgi:hypothetical protein